MSWSKHADSLSWSPGHLGAGYLLQDGVIKTWNVDPFRPEQPSDTYLRNGEQSPVALYFEVDPDGGVVTEHPSPRIKVLTETDPRLYDAGQRESFEDTFDLDKFEPSQKPNGKPDLNFIMSRTSMALRPEDAQRYIQEHGPYLEHWTRPQNVPGILRRGIEPSTHPSEDPPEDSRDPWDDSEPFDPGQGHTRRNWDGFIETRPGYTYLARPGTITGGETNNLGEKPYQVPVRVDLRKLDLHNLEADEDVAQRMWPEWKQRMLEEEGHIQPGEELDDYAREQLMAEHFPDQLDPPDSTYWEPETQGLADWASDIANRNDYTRDSLLDEHQGGSLAHQGTIPPEAISLHPDYMDQYPPEAGGLAGGQMSLFSKWHWSDYQGYTNWDTWNTKLMMDNEEPLYNAVRKLIERGAGPDQIRDWALRKVVGPYNKEQMADAKEWNAIPIEERKRQKRERDIAEFGEAAVNMGESLMQPFNDMENEGKSEDEIQRDEEYDAPDLIDPDLVNWQEIHQDLLDEVNENADYDKQIQDRKDQGLGWPSNHDEDINRMRDAMYRYHGANPDAGISDPSAYNNIRVQVPGERFKQIAGPRWPEDYLSREGANQAWELQQSLGKSNYDAKDWSDPRFQQIVAQDPAIQDIMQNGKSRSLSRHTWDLITKIQRGQEHPYTGQMQEALQQRGYTPEQIQQYMQPQWQWDEQLQNMIPINREPPVQQWQDTSADEPGNTYLPEGWDRTSAWELEPPHRNRWTGKLCNCGWGRPKRSRRTSGQNLNKLLKAPDKAWRTPEGQAFLEHLKTMPEEYDSLYPYLAQQYKKGRVRYNPAPDRPRYMHGDGPLPPRLEYESPTYLPSEETIWAPVEHRLPEWHEWFEARQHPTRRGVNIMDPDFTPAHMEMKAREHRRALEQAREKENWLGRYGGATPQHVFGPEAGKYKGWQVVPLDAYQAEGDSEALGHCIGNPEYNYHGAIDRREIDAYSLRDKEGYPHVSWHINPSGQGIGHMQGKSGDPPEEYRNLISHFNEAHNLPDEETGEEELAPAYDEYYQLPAATDMQEYILEQTDPWSIAQDDYDANIGENTELEFQEPQWDDIAYDYLNHPSQRTLEEFHRHLDRYREDEMAQALKNQLDPDIPEHREAIDYWNNSVDMRHAIEMPSNEMPSNAANEVDKYNEAAYNGQNPEPTDWDEMAWDYLDYPHVYQAESYGQPGEYDRFHDHANLVGHHVPMADALARNINWDTPTHVDAISHWNQAFPAALQVQPQGERPPSPFVPPTPSTMPANPVEPGPGQEQLFQASRKLAVAPADELREWLADLSGAPSIHHEDESDLIAAPPVSPSNALPYFPPANIPKEYKQAGMTRNQYLRQMAELEQKMGPDKSRLHHQFDNGWSVYAPKSQRDVKRTGTLMGHCWQNGSTGSGQPYVLRDPDGIPRIAWNTTAPHMVGAGYTPAEVAGTGTEVFSDEPHAPSGHNSSKPKPEHWDMLREWASAQNPPVKMWHYTGDRSGPYGGYNLGEPGPNPYFDPVTQEFIKTAMPANPDWWSTYQRQYPYLYHGTTDRAADEITKNGLIPWNQHDRGHNYQEEGWDTWLTPRHDHVYLTPNIEAAHSNAQRAFEASPGDLPHLLAVRTKHLQPHLVNPDEDNWPGGRRLDNDPTHSLGELAEAANWGEDPNDTEKAIGPEGGNVAYRGIIPPEAITPMEYHGTPEITSPEFMANPYDWQMPEMVKTADSLTTMYHVAPTGERARIQQHGLIPAKPALNWPSFDNAGPDEGPEGTYMFDDRSRADSYRTMLEFRRGQPHDVWAADTSKTLQDPDMGSSSQYVTQPMEARLVEGPEHREDMPEYMQPQYLRPGDPWKRGEWPYAENEGRGRPYPQNDPEAWDRLTSTKTADSPITQADATNDPLGKNPALIPSRKGDPDYLKAAICPNCLQSHRADEPCPDSAVNQYRQQERAWYNRDNNTVHGPGPGPSGVEDHQMDLGSRMGANFWDFRPEEEEPDHMTGYFEMECPTCARVLPDGTQATPGRIPDSDPNNPLGWKECPACGRQGTEELQLNGPVRGGDATYLPKMLEPEWGTLPQIGEEGFGPRHQGAEWKSPQQSPQTPD